MAYTPIEKGKEMNPTKLKILKTAVPLFFKEGYSNVTTRRLADEVGISTGNLTFHYPTREHLLLELTKAFCKYQWDMTLKYPKYKVSLLFAYALEISVQTAVCYESEIARDFYISAYTQPMTLAEIREWDFRKAQKIFREYNLNWTEMDFKEAENIASGIELSAMMAEREKRVSLEKRIEAVLDALMKLYNVPPDERSNTIEKIRKVDCMEIVHDILPRFSENIEKYIA